MILRLEWHVGMTGMILTLRILTVNILKFYDSNKLVY